MDKQLSMPDLLSDLPLGIIHNILSFLPIRGAIRTSILSRKWRYKWASLTHLAFDYECVSPLLEDGSDEKRLIHFISQTLLCHEGPIHTFELRLPRFSMEERHCIDQWLLFLSTNGIRNLLLEIHEIIEDPDYGPGFEISSSLYSCQKLTHLKLHVYTIPPPPPSFKGFLFLRSLDIFTEDEDCSTIESIVAHSPLLEKLTLLCLSVSVMPITIRAPNLKYFDLQCEPVHLSLCTPLLEEFIGPISFMKSWEESSVFCHLRIIKLWYSSFDDMEVLPMVIHLINGAPNLQQLEIESHANWMVYDPTLASVSFWNTEFAPHLTYHSLKVIEMENFGSYVDEMKIVEFLLARSPELEKMIYIQKQSISDEMLLKIRAQLLKFHKASANAEIVVRRNMIEWTDF